ncbi:MAG TPA: His/Gly/Thr/Pro-type tRNA ligase C-terminal domain-containing protein, partial [Solirubrobacteraceae bacterium]|nr:His/Gly/Thr/Pro-type tRNA ligase C-terminal domain-containing protein [Solirubrobacteraceae bacterium]
QYADEAGISWPAAIAPFAVHLVVLGKPGSVERGLADSLYESLTDAGVDVVYDDRDLGAGQKFADAELLGCPVRLTLGRRAAESGEVEVQLRRGREARPSIPLAGALAQVEELCRGLS